YETQNTFFFFKKSKIILDLIYISLMQYETNAESKPQDLLNRVLNLCNQFLEENKDSIDEQVFAAVYYKVAVTSKLNVQREMMKSLSLLDDMQSRIASDLHEQYIFWQERAHYLKDNYVKNQAELYKL
ncbi:MAG: hypothetical protein ABIA63_10275, partial [bacterium]